MRSVLFDVDGVLIDSYTSYREIWRRWSVARRLDSDLVWAATHGRRPVDTVAEVAPHLDAAQECIVLQRLVGEVEALFPAFPAAGPLLRSLQRHSWGVVTSGHRSTVLSRFAAGGIPAPLVLVDGDDVAQGKPAPDGYLSAAELLRTAPERCLVVEDSPAGIAAGKAAGMTVMAVGTTHTRGELAQADLHAVSLDAGASIIRAWLSPPPGAVEAWTL